MNPFIFQVFFDKMSEAQSEIKSTVTVNTTDIAARAHDDKDSVAAKDIERVVKKRACELLTTDNIFITIPITMNVPCKFLYTRICLCLS